eukprot:CAMPEP_0202921130 /NCGR_PEP_ID=MMETSP1392-20130828/77231_1 /ASSEMBLY_ACC=CAM_ASM_000868 /TAXON_ID=225041 /ORGANISM="Chlamydomonas chlamydogama, Strain SAG 11-48b" /LENGTH=217 /DNA_ID=CAMNT_0049614677 /DNA_START=156 /DNA_END=809 /DNA_ORIENTATION=-
MSRLHPAVGPELASSACVVKPTGWQTLENPAIWKGTEEEALLSSEHFQRLPPTWKVLLLSDGSVTRHLQLMTNSTVKVDCLEMKSIGHEVEGLPLGTDIIQGPRVQRQVLLRAGESQEPLVYASSWWNEKQVDEYLKDKSKPIWVSLSQGHVELYREVQQLYYGHNSTVERYLGCEGPLWGRHYFFWHDGAPLTLIYEVFSNKLAEFLGPLSPPERS